jgi:glycosyltransferase involved in cell wall biosynthesis
MKCCICAPVRNVGGHLNAIFSNIEQIATLFEDYRIIFYYDQSTDNTLQMLKDYQETNSKFVFYVNKEPTSKYRTHRIANARNGCLQMMKNNFSSYEMFIMMDCDDVCTSPVNLDIIRKYLYKNSWDALSFNKPCYYDTWALSIKPYMFSFLHYNNHCSIRHNMQTYIENILKQTPPNTLVRCASAFNGFAIYRTGKFIDCVYDGRPRLDLIPTSFLLLNAKVNNSNIIMNQQEGEIASINEDCEHRAFHLQAIQKNNARIRICPEILFS